MSQITTHILDTSRGSPASGVTVILYEGPDWLEIGRSITNADGRLQGLVKEGKLIKPGIYKLRFETKEYFDKVQIATLYPFIEIAFEIAGNDHYHIPLLLNPFGYSTYRGS